MHSCQLASFASGRLVLVRQVTLVGLNIGLTQGRTSPRGLSSGQFLGRRPACKSRAPLAARLTNDKRNFKRQDNIMSDLDYLLNQLNLLIGFLDVSDEQVYLQVKDHDRFNMGLTIGQLYDNRYDNYSNHITTSALLLGFSHLEDFLSKCIVKVLTSNPDKNDFKVTLKTIREKGDNLISSLAEEQAKRLTFAEKIKFIEKHLPGITPQILTDVKFVNDVRNCLMHNNGLADSRLIPKYQSGQKIILNSGEVNGYGLQARQLAREIWDRL